MTDREDDAPVILADFGGTNIRCALAERGALGLSHTLAADRFSTFCEALEGVCETLAPRRRPRAARLAVAGPPDRETMTFTNLDWPPEPVDALRLRLGLERLSLVNDFAGLAHALPHLGGADLRSIGGGIRRPGKPMAVLGPGTGLGVGGLIPAGETGEGKWLPVPGEGGHATLGARTDTEARLLAILGERYVHVSAERVLSGPGLSALHDTVREKAGLPVLNQDAAGVVELARGGDGTALQTLDHFADFLGTVAADVALTYGATGGLFLAGGVIPNMGELFPAARFRERFSDKGRFSDYCAEIATLLITRDDAALIGLAHIDG